MAMIAPRRFRKAIVFLSKALIVAVTLVTFVFVTFHYYQEALFYYKGNIILEFLYAVIFLAFGTTYGCFQVGILRLREIVFSYMIAVAFANFILYFILSLIAKDMLNIVPMLVMMGVQGVLSALLYLLANRIYFLLYPARDSIIICSAAQDDNNFVSKFRRLNDRYDIRLVCRESLGYEKLAQHIDRYSSVVLADIDIGLRAKLISYCFEHNKRLYIMPTLQDIMINNADEIQVGDSLVYLCKNRMFSNEQSAIKRMVDIVISSLGLILTSPIILLTALAIKLEDGGSIIYRQRRLTLDGRGFMLFKFRSMIEDAEKDGACFASKNDRRITRVGRWIRATRIDELPQLINVLKGEMSLVGPRPERPEIFEENCKAFPQFKYRLKVKAGLTGYAQIYGKYNTTFEDKVKMDLLYIENSSLRMDLRLLFSTLKVIFMRESSEGFEDKQEGGLDVREKMNRRKI